MKKSKFSCLVLLLIVCVSIFAGCTKADNATMKEVISKFNVEIDSQLYKDYSHVGASIIKKSTTGSGTKYVFTYCPDDNGALVSTIYGANLSSYSILRDDREYGMVLNHASKYFFEKILNNNWYTANADNFDKIPQKELTKLYNEVQATLNKIDVFGDYAKILSSSFSLDTVNNPITLGNRDELLKQYQGLISQVLSLNFVSQEITDKYLGSTNDFNNLEVVSSTEIARLVDTFELYITEYLFERYMVFGGELNVDLSENELLAKMNSVIDTLNTKINNKTLKDISNNDTYKYLRNVEQSLNTYMTINRSIVKDLDAKMPSSDDANYSQNLKKFQKFNGYEDELFTYMELLSELIG